MSKIGNAFKNGKAFIGFLTAGDPSLDKTYEYIMTMERPERTSSKSASLFPIPSPKASSSRKRTCGL